MVQILDQTAARLRVSLHGRTLVEMAVVRMAGSFGGRRLLSLDEAWTDAYGLRTPFAAWQVEDSPELSGGRHAADDPERARSYWLFEEPSVFARAA